jgi:hypothetical protein
MDLQWGQKLWDTFTLLEHRVHFFVSIVSSSISFFKELPKNNFFKILIFITPFVL